jgi:hypothetical protein
MRWLFSLLFILSIAGVAHVQSAVNPTPIPAGGLRTLQSFGAVGNGVTDDTKNVQTALNSGSPLLCNGKFLLTSLVTITNVNVYLQGSAEGCTFILNNSQTMIYATLTGASVYNYNHLTMKDVKFSINAVITNVTGPAQTAALLVNYPLGTNGITEPTVTLENIQIKPTAASNYILNGIYCFDCTNAWMYNIEYEGNRNSVDINSHAIAWDGTHAPANVHIVNGYADFVGAGIWSPQQTAGGWQGIRVQTFDCVFCAYIIDVVGSLDGLSDQVDVAGAEGAFVQGGIRVVNALHVNMHENYVFSTNATGITAAVFPTCYSLTWTIAIPSNAANSSISNNTCDQAGVSGYTDRYGINIAGVNRTNMNTYIGVNTLSNMDVGWVLSANTAGVTIETQLTKNMAVAQFTDSSTAGDNTVRPPQGIVNGTNAAAGNVGEHIGQTVLSAGAITMANGTGADIATAALTAGDWTCNGSIATSPAGTTTQSDFIASISTTANTPSTQPIGYVRYPVAVSAGNSFEASVGPVRANITSTTTYHLVGYSIFAVSTMKMYGFIDCVRMR